MTNQPQIPAQVDTELERAVRELNQEIYNTCCRIYQDLEIKGKIMGNGHHLAQHVQGYAENLLRERWRGKSST